MRTALMALLVAVFPACSGSDATGKPCGGNIANAPTCPSGYTCVPAYDGELPDLAGICKKNE